MADLSLSDVELFAEPDVLPEATQAPQIATKRGRGRPRGTFGSRVIREHMQELDQQQAPQQPQPGDGLAYARLCRSEKAAARRQEREKLAERGVMVTSESNLEVLATFAPPTCLAKASNDSIHLDLQNALVKTRQEYEEDALIDQHLQGNVASISYNAFEKLAGDNNAGRRVLSVVSAMFEFSVMLWSALLVLVTTSKHCALRPVMVLLRLRYDETPTKVRIADHRGKESIESFAKLTPEEAVAANLLGSETDSNYAKVLQVQEDLGMLMHDPETNKYRWTWGPVPTLLYGLERTTGRHTFFALRDAVESISQYRDVSQTFPLNIRHTCSDKYTANFTAEAYLSGWYSGSTLTHLFCDVHRLYSVTKACLSIADSDISGCLAWALGLGEPGIVPKMRQALSQILLSRLEVRYETRPEGPVTDYRKAVFDTFLPVKQVSASRRRLNRKRRFILNYYLTGALWENTVVHHCPYSCCSSGDATLKGIAVFVTWALVPHRCPLFPRARWTRSDEAIDFLGLLCAVHNLLEPLTTAMTGGPDKDLTTADSDQQGAAEVLAALDQAQDDNFDEWAELMREEHGFPTDHANAGDFHAEPRDSDYAFMEPEPEQPEMQHEQQDPEQPQQADGEAEAANAAATVITNSKDDQWREEKKKNKKKARAWSRTNPLPRLALMKEALSILMHLMFRFLNVSGQAWERRQRSRAAQNHPRSYRILHAHIGADVQEAMNELSNTWQTSPNILVMTGQYTQQMKSVRFRLIAKAMCGLHCYLRVRRNGFPYKLFLALQGPHQNVEAVIDAPHCMHDALTRLFLEKYDAGSNWQIFPKVFS